MFFSRPKKIVTHSGSFHADDLFACATLSLYFDKKNISHKITRSRDQKIIEEADIVVDVGAVYDPIIERYDHHQQGGAGKRDNGIPYASFGLVWKEYGFKLCGSEGLMQEIDRRLVQPIDAIDNGISISESLECGLYDYGIHGIVSAYQCTWKEAGNTQKQYRNFIELIDFFKGILSREIEQSKHRIEMIDIIKSLYEKSERKDIIEVPYHVSIGPLMQALDEHREVMYIVSKSNTNWKVLALRKESCSFENRKSLPSNWAGKRSDEFQKLTGVSDALFCHNALFMAVAESREGAWKLAELAVGH